MHWMLLFWIMHWLHGEGQSTQYFPFEYVVKGHCWTQVIAYERPVYK